jgi:hypothetical protein
MQTQQPPRAVGVFEDQDHAIAAARALIQAGFAPKQIVLLARDWKGPELTKLGLEAQHAADDGAMAGALIGGTAGLAAGLLTALVPGPGQGGDHQHAQAGAGGAAVGAYVGPFVGMEMSEAEAREHAGHVEEGRTVLVVRTPDRQDEARSVMVDHGAYDFSMSTD